MKSILVPLDGSALAEQTLPYVRMLATLLGAKVHLLRVVAEEEKEDLVASNAAVLYEVGAVEAPMPAREMRIWDMLRQHAEGYLDDQAMRLRQGGLHVDVHVQVGSPADTIVEVAEHTDADLIAMATHGYSGIKRWALGSVTDKVVQATTTPVFVVPGGAAPSLPRLRRIMLTLDGSEFAKQALPCALDLVFGARAGLILFEAIAPTLDVFQGITLPADVQIALRDQAFKELRAVAGELRSYEITATTVVINGYAAEKIVEVASQHQADLIVMATHGYSAIKRWALGSVADKVLHATSTPLLLVHARSHA
jgi:nucleotide-binding universal stress UspA family protein